MTDEGIVQFNYYNCATVQYTPIFIGTYAYLGVLFENVLIQIPSNNRSQMMRTNFSIRTPRLGMVTSV